MIDELGKVDARRDGFDVEKYARRRPDLEVLGQATSVDHAVLAPVGDEDLRTAAHGANLSCWIESR